MTPNRPRATPRIVFVDVYPLHITFIGTYPVVIMPVVILYTHDILIVSQFDSISHKVAPRSKLVYKQPTGA